LINNETVSDILYLFSVKIANVNACQLLALGLGSTLLTPFDIIKIYLYQALANRRQQSHSHSLSSLPLLARYSTFTQPSMSHSTNPSSVPCFLTPLMAAVPHV